MRPQTALVLFLIIVFLQACSVGPNYRRPDVKVAAAYHELGQTATTNPPIAAWWQTFHDPELNHLVAQVLRGNYDLKMATARIRQSRYQRNIAAADLFPEANASAGYLRARGSENIVLPLGGSGGESSGGSSSTKAIKAPVKAQEGGATSTPQSPPLTVLGEGGLPGVTSDVYQAGFDASWEIDVFGGKRRSVEAASATLAATTENRRDFIVSLLAEVARDYLELRSGQERLEIARTNFASQDTIAELTRSKRKAGLATELDVARAASQAETTEATIPPLEAAVRQMIHALSILTGQEPDQLSAELQAAAPWPVTPPDIPVGLPSQLLRRRPDIRASERQLAAANARIGVAQADLFPKFALVGNAGLDSSSPGTLFNWESRYFLISPTVSWRIFDAGRVLSNVKLQKSAKEETAYQYHSTILKALGEVEDALVAYASEQTRRRQLEESARNARLAVDLARQDYDHGLVDFLNVLEAEATALKAEDLLAQSKGAVCADLVAVYKALGGGWEVADK